MENIIKAMLSPLRVALRNMARRGLATLIDDSGEFQKLQVRIGREERNDIDRWQDYGRSSHPPKNSKLLTLNLGSNPDGMIVIGVAHGESRPRELAEGEQILFDMHGDKFIHFRADGTLHIKAPRLLLEGVQQVEARAPYVKHYASERLRQDVAGYATELAFTGGASWQQVAWSIGATVEGEANPISPPEVEA